MNFEEMYADYVRHMYGAEIYVTEHGWVQFALPEERDRIVLMEIYIKPEYRNSGIKYYKELADVVAAHGRVNRVKFMTAKVSMDHPEKDKILRCHQYYGMKLLRIMGNDIWNYKEI